MRADGPAQEPAATARVRRDASGVEPAACDDVRQPVDGRAEPGLEVLIGRLDLAAQPGQGLGVGVRRAQAEEVQSLPPGIGRVLDRLEPGPLGGLALLQPADEPGEGPAGQFGCQVRDTVAQAEGVDEDREVVGGEDLALLQDRSRSPRPGCRSRRRYGPRRAREAHSAAKPSSGRLPPPLGDLGRDPSRRPGPGLRGGEVVVARVQRPVQQAARRGGGVRPLAGEGPGEDIRGDLFDQRQRQPRLGRQSAHLADQRVRHDGLRKAA